MDNLIIFVWIVYYKYVYLHTDLIVYVENKRWIQRREDTCCPKTYYREDGARPFGINVTYH